MADARPDEQKELVGGRDPTDPMKGGKKGKRDKWWKYKDKNFQRWYHRKKKKERHYRNVDKKEEMEEYYNEWLANGKPQV